MKRKIVFKIWQSPGDCLVSTSALRELHRNHPLGFVTDIISPYPEIFYKNPYVTSLKGDKEAIEIPLFYYNSLPKAKNSGIHFSDGYIESINKSLNLKIIKDSMYPELYLTDEELDRNLFLRKFDIQGKFWLFNAGIKIDIPLKAWPIVYWENLISKLKSRGLQLIQVGSNKHIHPHFNYINPKSLVGNVENLRDYLVLCYHSEGHIGPVSLQTHIMAAYKKPCIVLAGGREDPRWEMYQNQIFLHSVGIHKCCREGGCWKKQRDECVSMVRAFNVEFPSCMWSIHPDLVLNYVDLYEKKGKLWN